MQANHPTKEQVREVMQQHRNEGTPPMSPEEFRTKLGWGMLQDERELVAAGKQRRVVGR